MTFLSWVVWMYFVDDGKHETIVLNYQTLDDDVIDYNKRFQLGSLAGFSIFGLMIILMSWGLTYSID